MTHDQLFLLLDGFRVRFSDYQDLLVHVMFKLVCQVDQDETPAVVLSTRERQQLMAKKRLISFRVCLIAEIAPEPLLQIKLKLRPKLEEALDIPVDLVTQSQQRPIKTITQQAIITGLQFL